MTLVSGTQITATSPAVVSTGPWYVQVVTIGGSTPKNGTSVKYSYSALPPLIINLSPHGGGPSSNPKVATITISGKNFLAGGTTVTFYPWNGTALGTPGTAASVTVTSPTSLTVTVPSGLTAGTTYYPQITISPSSGNLTSQPYNEPADLFVYGTTYTP